MGLRATRQPAALLPGVPADEPTHLLHLPHPSGGADRDGVPDAGTAASAAHDGGDDLSRKRSGFVHSGVRAVRAVRGADGADTAVVLPKVEWLFLGTRAAVCNFVKRGRTT